MLLAFFVISRLTTHNARGGEKQPSDQPKPTHRMLAALDVLQRMHLRQPGVIPQDGSDWLSTLK